jgi:hypothetical protein
MIGDPSLSINSLQHMRDWGNLQPCGYLGCILFFLKEGKSKTGNGGRFSGKYPLFLTENVFFIILDIENVVLSMWFFQGSENARITLIACV